MTRLARAIPAEIFEGRDHGSIFGTLMLAAIAGGALGPWSTGAVHDLTGSHTPGCLVAIFRSIFSALAIWRADVVEDRVQIGPHSLQRQDDRDGDTGCNESIFDGGSATLIAEKVEDEFAHVWRAGATVAIGTNAVDMMDNARALPTCPRQQQQKQTTPFAA